MKLLILTTLLFLIIFCSRISFSAKVIFLFAGGNLSHKSGIWPFVIGLANRGHQITFFSSNGKQLQSHPNVTDFAPDVLAKATGQVYNIDRFKQRENGEESQHFTGYADASLRMCKLLLNRTDLQLREIIDKVDYDLAIVNSVFGECGTLIATHFGCKTIVFSSSTIIAKFHGTFGVPWQASYIPDMINAVQFTYPLGFFERLQNMFAFYRFASRAHSFTSGLDNLMKERFDLESVPSFVEMERNASLVFVNIHHTLDYGRPLPPMFIPVGGMSCWAEIGKLPENLQDFMDQAEDGVVLIAFGSTVDLSSLSTHYLDKFFNMMRQLEKIRFIWRWTGEPSANPPSNLMGAPWLPQKEILNHPKIRGFMTHCGLNSITEATCFGVPLIGVPLFADQDYTAYRLEAQEIGVKLEIRGLTQEIMDSTVEKILSNTKYRNNMITRSKILKDQPQNPIETAIFWTEFVLRHDDMSSFRPMNLDQSILVRHLVDVYFASFVIIIILPLMLAYLVVKLFHKFLG